MATCDHIFLSVVFGAISSAVPNLRNPNSHRQAWYLTVGRCDVVLPTD